MRVGIPFISPVNRARARVRQLSRTQSILLLGAVLLLLLAGYAAYQRATEGSRAAPAAQTVPARVGSLVSTVSATGSVVAAQQAKLSFGSTGKLAELNVTVGQAVSAGQTLARLDQPALQLKVAQSESALKVSEAKLQQLKDGATPEEVNAAKAAYDSALAKYQEVSARPTNSDLQAAQSTVDQAAANLAAAEAKLEQVKAAASQNEQAILSGYDQAKANLTAAEAKLEQVKNPSQADRATALAQLESARATLASAQSKLDQLKSPTAADVAAAQAAVDSAKQSLITAEDKYEMAQGDDLASSGFTSVSAAKQNYDNAKANYEAKIQALNSLMSPSELDLQGAQASLDAAKNSFSAAQAKVDQLQAGPLAGDLAAAQATVDQAKASLATAQAKVDQLRAGSAESDLKSAQATVDQARASLATAQGKLDELKGAPKAADLQAARSTLASAQASLALKANPPKVTDLILAEEQVRQSEISLKQARLDQENATLVAPFDGVISAITGNVGEQVSGAVITLVNTKSARIDATVDESDVAKLAVGQQTTVTFDALPELQLRGKVIAVAPAGTAQQGVVSYLVSVSFDAADRTLPSGMSASLNIVTEKKDGVLLVPNRAVRTQGRAKTVEVMAGEKPEVRPVQTGSANDQFTEIVSGLTEGEQVVIPTTTIRSSFAPSKPNAAVKPNNTVIMQR